MILILAVDVERELTREAGERGQRPRGQRVSVDGEGNRGQGSGAGGDLRRGIRCEGIDLAGEPQVGDPRAGRGDGLAAGEQHTTHRVLKGANALADRGRRDMQRAGRGVEGSAVDRGRERLELQ